MSKIRHTTNAATEVTAPALRPPVPIRPDYSESLPVWASGPLQGHVAYITHKVVTERDAARQALEDKRSIHRNRNRFLTLAGALVISFILTYVLQHGYLGAYSKTLGPYAFCITITLDSIFTLYAYIRRY